MFCSTIIPTIGRATLTKAVSSLLDQSFAAHDFEVIVVNDTGIRLRPAGWMDSPTVRVLETNRRERSVARNAGAAIARGEYLHFLDDDDWMLSDALATFQALARLGKSAAVLYGGVRFVDAAANSLGEIGLGRSDNCYTQLVAGSLILPLGLLVRADAFSAVGGFDPRFAISEDVGLASTLTAAPSLAQPDFWRALQDDHIPCTQARILGNRRKPES